MNRSNKPADNHATSKQVFCWRGGCLSGLTFLDSSVALKAWLCRDNGLAKEDTEILSQKGKFARFGFDRLLEGKFQTEIEIFSRLFYNDNSPIENVDEKRWLLISRQLIRRHIIRRAWAAKDTWANFPRRRIRPGRDRREWRRRRRRRRWSSRRSSHFSSPSASFETRNYSHVGFSNRTKMVH